MKQLGVGGNGPTSEAPTVAATQRRHGVRPLQVRRRNKSHKVVGGPAGRRHNQVQGKMRDDWPHERRFCFAVSGRRIIEMLLFSAFFIFHGMQTGQAVRVQAGFPVRSAGRTVPMQDVERVEDKAEPGGKSETAPVVDPSDRSNLSSSTTPESESDLRRPRSASSSPCAPADQDHLPLRPEQHYFSPPPVTLDDAKMMIKRALSMSSATASTACSPLSNYTEDPPDTAELMLTGCGHDLLRSSCEDVVKRATTRTHEQDHVDDCSGVAALRGGERGAASSLLSKPGAAEMDSLRLPAPETGPRQLQEQLQKDHICSHGRPPPPPKSTTTTRNAIKVTALSGRLLYDSDWFRKTKTKTINYMEDQHHGNDDSTLRDETDTTVEQLQDYLLDLHGQHFDLAPCSGTCAGTSSSSNVPGAQQAAVVEDVVGNIRLTSRTSCSNASPSTHRPDEDEDATSSTKNYDVQAKDGEKFLPTKGAPQDEPLLLQPLQANHFLFEKAVEEVPDAMLTSSTTSTDIVYLTAVAKPFESVAQLLRALWRRELWKKVERVDDEVALGREQHGDRRFIVNIDVDVHHHQDQLPSAEEVDEKLRTELERLIQEWHSDLWCVDNIGAARRELWLKFLQGFPMASDNEVEQQLVDLTLLALPDPRLFCTMGKIASNRVVLELASSSRSDKPATTRGSGSETGTAIANNGKIAGTTGAAEHNREVDHDNGTTTQRPRQERFQHDPSLTLAGAPAQEPSGLKNEFLDYTAGIMPTSPRDDMTARRRQKEFEALFGKAKDNSNNQEDDEDHNATSSAFAVDSQHQKGPVDKSFLIRALLFSQPTCGSKFGVQIRANGDVELLWSVVQRRQAGQELLGGVVSGRRVMRVSNLFGLRDTDM
ncbi:unnamed protein product [Amoebophrya sp. A120]|nr:unnamed protein product [Amoebophrya sp. A120]|eukprot:GSA120T00018208001.1